MILLSNNLRKTLAIASIAAAISAWVSFSIQSTANSVAGACSYLDPITIDIAAFIAGVFLVTEGIIEVFAHREHRVRAQMGRVIRICFGVSVIIIHIMQFLHK